MVFQPQLLGKSVFLLLFSLIVYTGGIVRADDSPNTPKIHAFVPTDRLNPAKGRVDALRMEFQDVNLNQMGEVLLNTKEVLPKFDSKNIPIIPFYISKLRPAEEQGAMVQAARNEFQKAYPGVEPKIQVRYLEDEEVDVEAISKRLDQNIESLADVLPKDDATKKEMELLKEANRRALIQTLEAAKKKEGILDRPSLVNKMVNALAGVRALFSFGTRAGLAIEAGNQGAGPVMAGLALVSAGPANEYFSTVFEREIGLLMNEHPLLPEKLRVGILGKINEAYTHSETAKFIKGSLGNALIFGMADPLAMQALGHINNPGYIPAVTREDAGIMAAAAIPGAFLYNGAFIGMEKLRQKGWMTTPAVDLAVRAIGLSWQVAEVLLSTGRPEFREAVPLILAPLWAGLGAAIVAPAFLPARNNRLVLVDSALGNRDAINRLEALDSTHTVENQPEKIAEEVVKVAGFEALVKPKSEQNRLERIVGSISENCRNLLGRLSAKK